MESGLLFPEEAKPKKKRGTSPTRRSLVCLRENGWMAHIVEKWIPPRGDMKFGVRIDAFGFGDILAMRMDTYGPTCEYCKGKKTRTSATGLVHTCDGCHGAGRILVGPKAIALVQCTSDNGGNMAAHRAKIEALPEFFTWKEAGGRVFLQGWAKKGPRGARKRWTMREIEL